MPDLVKPRGGRFAEAGRTGLEQYGGVIHEEWLRKLQGDRAARVFRRMADNDAIVGAVLFSVEMLLRNVSWRVEPFGETPEHEDQAEFVESLMDDMSHSWADLVAEILTMLPFGYSVHEIVYKRREGPTQADPRRRSRHDDGLIGWRKLPIRSQDTIDRWEFDDEGGIRGVWQSLPTASAPVFIPIEKLLLFRTTSRKNNPEGRSVLRNAYVSWYHRTRIAEFEAIGVERDLAGMPVFYLPPGLFDPDASPEEKAQLAAFRQIVENVKNDEQAGLLLPAMFTEDGKNRIVEFQLAGTGSRRMFDTGAILGRYSREIAMTVLADFILLGHEKVGSFALSSDKTELFSTALGAWLGEVATVLNRHGLPRLYDLNGWNPAEVAQFVPGDLEKEDVTKFAENVSKLTAAGFLTSGSEEDEDFVREMMGMPATPVDLLAEREDAAREAEAAALANPKGEVP